MENKKDYNKVLREIHYMLKKAYSILERTDNNQDKESHLIALGEIMALNDIKYSILNNDFIYENKKKESENNE